MKKSVIFPIIAALFLIAGCNDEVRVTGVSLNQNEISLTAGESATLQAIVSPSNATLQTIYWNTSDPGVVEITNGRISTTPTTVSNLNTPNRNAVVRVSTMDSEFEDFCHVTVTGYPVITMTSQPASIINLIANGSGNLIVTANATEGASLGYQWFRNTTNSNTGGVAIMGATSATYTIPASNTGTTYYFCEVRANNGISSLRSNVATVNVTYPAISITTQPAANTNVIAGSITGSLYVVASVTPLTQLSYQWYSASSPVAWGGTSISGATGASFPIPTNLTETRYFYCEVRAGVSFAYSNVATVNVSQY